MRLVHLLLEPLHALMIITNEILVHHLTDGLLIIVQFLYLRIQSILRQLELLGLVAQNLILNLSFQPKHRLLEQNQQSARTVKLVDELITLLKELSRDNVLNILRRILDPALQIRNLLVFQV